MYGVDREGFLLCLEITAERTMTGLPQKPPSSSKKPKPLQPDKKHQNELLDEALEETFPASDPLAMTEPGLDSSPADDDEQDLRRTR